MSPRFGDKQAALEHFSLQSSGFFYASFSVALLEALAVQRARDADVYRALAVQRARDADVYLRFEITFRWQTDRL